MKAVEIAMRALLAGTAFAVAGAELLDHVVADEDSAALLLSARRFFADVQRQAEKRKPA